MVCHVQTVRKIGLFAALFIALTVFTGATVYNDVENCLKGLCEKYAYYVGGIKYDPNQYNNRDGYLFVFEDWATVSGDFSSWDGKCFMYHVPYYGPITKEEVTAVDLTDLNSIHSNVQGSVYPAYVGVNRNEIIFRKTLEACVFVAALGVGLWVTLDLFNFRR